MALIQSIDRSKPMYLDGNIEVPHHEPVIEELALQMNQPQLRYCDVSSGDRVTLPPSEANSFLSFLAMTDWGSIVEQDLQCMSQTSEGDPLLTSWLELDQFVELAEAAYAAGALPPLSDVFERWSASGVVRVYIEGFRFDRREGQLP